MRRSSIRLLLTAAFTLTAGLLLVSSTTADDDSGGKKRDDGSIEIEGLPDRPHPVPWGEAVTATSDHYAVTSNCPTPLFRAYIEFLERSHAALTPIFPKVSQSKKPKKRTNVFIFHDYDDFLEIVREMGVGGFYVQDNLPTIPAGSIVAYHGAFGTDSDTRTVLLHEVVHEFERSVLSSLHNLPTWLTEGLAVYFEDGYESGKRVVLHERGAKGAKGAAILPRVRLWVLRHRFDQDGPVPLEEILTSRPPQFSGYHYAPAWSLVHWLEHGEGRKPGTVLSLLSEARSKPLSDAEVQSFLEKETGLSLEEVQAARVAHVRGLELPATGSWRKNHFWSHRMRFELDKPSGGWRFEPDTFASLEGALFEDALSRQIRIEHSSGADVGVYARHERPDKALRAEARKELREASGGDEPGAGELREAWLAKLQETSSEEAIGRFKLDPVAEHEEEAISVGDRPAVRFTWEEGSADPFGAEDDGAVDPDDDDGDDDGVHHVLVVIRLLDRSYQIHAALPAAHGERLRSEVDRLVESFEIEE